MSDLARRLIAECKRTRSTHLDLGNCDLWELPEEIADLEWLEWINFASEWYEWDGIGWQRRITRNEGPSNRSLNGISGLRHLTGLRCLMLDGTRVVDLEPLAGLSALTSLYLAHTPVADLGALEGLQKLETLDFTHSSVASLAPLANLRALTMLDVSFTPVADLAPIAGLRALRKLNAYNTRITDAGPLAGLTALTTLTLSHTSLASLDPLDGLSSLIGLDVSYTEVSDLSPLAGLSTLQTLVLTRTNAADLSPLLPRIASGIPVSWETLPRQGEISAQQAGIFVQDCPLTNPPPEIVHQGNQAILNYFAEKAAGETDNIYEAKMLIVGKGGAGKTSLLRRLFKPEADLPAADETTGGIDIHRHEWTLPNGHTFRLNVWDFGGQHIYHATHQFFLTRRSLYLLVDDTVESDKNVTDPGFQYWLDRVEVYGGDSPVLVFQNEKGGLSKSIDFDGIRSRYPNVQRRKYAADLKARDCVGHLREAIQHLASTMPHIADRLPAKWVRVREEIETRARTTPYMAQHEYFEIYGRHLPFDATKALFLSQYLHDLGVFLHFQEDPLLARTVILQNEWATQAVFKILRDKAIIDNRGRFTYDDCRRLWRDSSYQEMIPELVGLMRKFELCYELPDRQPVTFLAPLLLPPARPAALVDWQQPGDLTLRYRYTFLPTGIVSRLTVRLNRYVRDPETAWTTGVLFEKDGSSLLVELLRGGGDIELRARGPAARDLLNLVAADLDAMHEAIQGLRGRVDALMPCRCAACVEAKTPHYYSKAALVRRREHGRRTIECEVSYEDVEVLALLEGLPRSGCSEPVTTPRRDDGIVRIFLASSAELREERDEFDRYFSRMDGIKIVRWEDFLDALSPTRKQDDYNQAVRDCDIFVSLFATKAGNFTVEEFETALAQFQRTGRPAIYTFFKDTSVKVSDANLDALKSLKDFQQRLSDLGHFYTTFTHIDDLKLRMRDQLDKIKNRR